MIVAKESWVVLAEYVKMVYGKTVVAKRATDKAKSSDSEKNDLEKALKKIQKKLKDNWRELTNEQKGLLTWFRYYFYQHKLSE